MDLQEMMSVIRILPDEVELGHINYVIEDVCPSIIDSTEYKLWRKAVVKQEMYQGVLINALEDKLEEAPEFVSIDFIDKYTRRHLS